MWNDKPRDTERGFSIWAIIKWVESDLMSLAQRQTGSQLPTECVFFPLFFNYRLDLIKSFCDISQWLVITSIKNMIPEQQSGDSFFFFFFSREKICQFRLLAPHNFLQRCELMCHLYAASPSSPPESRIFWQNQRRLFAVPTRVHLPRFFNAHLKVMSHFWFHVPSIKFPFRGLREESIFKKVELLNSILRGLSRT